jgi:hypothetical protein
MASEAGVREDLPSRAAEAPMVGGAPWTQPA